MREDGLIVNIRWFKLQNRRARLKADGTPDLNNGVEAALTFSEW